MTMMLYQRILIEADALVMSDPPRCARLRAIAQDAYRMEFALDEIVCDAQEQAEAAERVAVGEQWRHDARNHNVVVILGGVG